MHDAHWIHEQDRDWEGKIENKLIEYVMKEKNIVFIKKKYLRPSVYYVQIIVFYGFYHDAK